ncbi:HPr kinase/phosphorylase [Erythrobacter sp. HL-111]|uniref:HPr kinase/phosphorylase n=1 Tax=Erythrobacter sp. HL-111 TaxID=1798193 RepID=UPI0006D97D94|nr:serine kinase [Erythrobacter sp. HL-111]KPP88796.1 MAG: Hpr(Ser) kinase/phosphatase [Erythrobacteraceae bacterium HL-111]SDR68409.1 Hpr(Ser) kinase/phosphatase [Erythrobacter sp. HL-111]
MAEQPGMVLQASAVAIAGRALLIEGAPGSGKSSLALALIDRGAGLIGDDGVTLTRRRDGTLVAAPPPHIAGLIELRGIGIVRVEPAPPCPVALILTLPAPDDAPPERLPERAARRTLFGCEIPVLAFDPGTVAPAARAEWALRIHGLAPPA